MRRTRLMRLFAGFLALFLLWCGQAAAAASETTSDSAKKIQLVETEGDVTVTDSSKNNVSLSRNGETRLYSGYHIVTGKDSFAWFSLDESKAVKLDVSSEVEVRSRGRKLELLLISGALYCNVSEPLKENETFQIRTSTMVMGIRGTVLGVDIGRTRTGMDTITMIRGSVEVRLTTPESLRLPSIWVREGQTYSHSQDPSGHEKESPAPVKEIVDFFANAMKEDGIPSPWEVKAEEGSGAVEPAAPVGKVSNLFNDSGEPAEEEYVFTDEEEPEPNQDPETTFTVTWLNDDGTVLEKDEAAAKGSTPSYDGEEPSKAATPQYTYTFSGWDKELAAVTEDATYTAVYGSTVNKYTVTFQDYNGDELQSGELAYGETPEYGGEEPSRAATPQYTYTFSGWDEELAAVTGDATYTAVYESRVNKYTVTFLDENGDVLQSGEVAYGEMPSYNGSLPMVLKGQVPYAFSYWTSGDVKTELETVTGRVTYTAVYEQAYKLTLHLESQNGHFFGEMSDQYLQENGFTPEVNGQVPDEVRTVSKWCVKGKETVLPDAEAVTMQEDTDGYFFLGWHDENSTISESVIPMIGEDNEDDRVLYALYAVDEEHIGYEVNYTDNGGVVLSFGYYNAASVNSKPNQIPAAGFTESPWGSLADGTDNGKISYLEIVFTEVLRPVSMSYWFSGLNGCDRIDFNNLDTSLVTDMNHLFAGSSMNELDLGCFDTRNVTNMSGMFEDCDNLINVYVGKTFDVTDVPEDSILFSGCQSLTGEQGTEFSPGHITAEYARIDGGREAPGYFHRSELYYYGS